MSVITFSSVGADMDVCLMNYGHCNYVSGKHACIFYDEVTDVSNFSSSYEPDCADRQRSLCWVCFA